MIDVLYLLVHVVVQSVSEGFNKIFKFGDEADGDDNTNEVSCF